MSSIKIKEGCGIDRDKFILAIRKRGIGASVHFEPPCHLQDAYMNIKCSDYKSDEKSKIEKIVYSQYKEGMFPVAEKLAKHIVTLPMYPDLSQAELNYMVDMIKETINEQKN